LPWVKLGRNPAIDSDYSNRAIRMIEQSRHVPLLSVPWDPSEVATAIDEIVADALAQFDRERLWPSHALDDGIKDGHSSIYVGAAGVIWALEYLNRQGATKARFDFLPSLGWLLEKTQAEMVAYADYSENGSLLFGDLGTALLIRRTSDAIWLERARTFAMTAIAQCREARGRLGRGRYSLWTGDVGLAVYLWDCLTTAPRFPTVDVF
jgi:hypothetical protein